MAKTAASVTTAAERLREQTGTLAEDLKEFGRIGQDVAREKLGQARDMAMETFETGRQKVATGKGQLETYVREQPVKSLLIAAAAGLVFGMFLTRKR